MTREVIFDIQGWRKTAYILEEEYKRKAVKICLSPPISVLVRYEIPDGLPDAYPYVEVELFFRKVENGMAVFEWNGSF